MKNLIIKCLSKILKRIGKLFSPFPYVEICSIHLGHTIIESATTLRKKPLAIIWRKPVANKWLIGKIQENLRYPKINSWINKYYEKENCIRSVIHMLFTNISDQYWLLNLGYNNVPSGLTINFSKDEETSAEKFMSKLGLIKNKYVCFCIRDESYYEEFKSDLHEMSTGTNFSFRNADIKNYSECANELLKRGLKPVIMGFSKADNLSSEEVKRLYSIPYIDPDFRPAIEAYIFKNCAFCIGMMTGGTLYAKLFSRPVLWTDIFWRGAPVGAKSDMIVPKKILLESPKPNFRKRLLNFKEMSDLGPPPDNDWSHFQKSGLSVINSSSDDLRCALVDMLTYLDTQKYFQSNEEYQIHRRFSSLHFKSLKKTLITPTRLAPSWAKKNRSLLFAESINYCKHWAGDTRHEADVDVLAKRRMTKNLFGNK